MEVRWHREKPFINYVLDVKVEELCLYRDLRGGKGFGGVLNNEGLKGKRRREITMTLIEQGDNARKPLYSTRSSQEYTKYKRLFRKHKTQIWWSRELCAENNTSKIYQKITS